MKKLLILFLLLCQNVYAQPITNLANLEGKPATWKTTKNKVLVVFWGTWCVDCKEKLKQGLPEMDHSPDVAVIAVNVDRDVGRAKSFIDSEKIGVTVLTDPNREMQHDLKVFSVPHWAVYNRKASTDAWSLVESAPAFDWAQVKQALAK